MGTSVIPGCGFWIETTDENFKKCSRFLMKWDINDDFRNVKNKNKIFPLNSLL
jgi:hypothetical protein